MKAGRYVRGWKLAPCTINHKPAFQEPTILVQVSLTTVHVILCTFNWDILEDAQRRAFCVSCQLWSTFQPAFISQSRNNLGAWFLHQARERLTLRNCLFEACYRVQLSVCIIPIQTQLSSTGRSDQCWTFANQSSYMIPYGQKVLVGRL